METDRYFIDFFYDCKGRLTKTIEMVPGRVMLNNEKGHSLKCWVATDGLMRCSVGRGV